MCHGAIKGLVGDCCTTFVAHSIRFLLTALQRTLGHTVEQCIASKAQSLCHACTRDKEGDIERAEWEAKGCG